jgi:hypothetical protein
MQVPPKCAISEDILGALWRSLKRNSESTLPSLMFGNRFAQSV